MFRVSLANAFAKRTCTPLYEKHQATPFAGTLGAAHVTALDVYSGMVASLDTDGTFIVSDGADGWGLFALDANASINDLDGQPSGTAPFAVWTGGPDALFKVTTLSSNSGLGAFEDTGTYSVGAALFPGDTAGVAEPGQLTDEDTGQAPVGRVVEVVSSTILIVQILLPNAAV